MYQHRMGRSRRPWPTPPGSMPPYYLRLSVAPVVRAHLPSLKGFGRFWEDVRDGLPSMTKARLIELKLCALSAWILKDEKTVRPLS